MGRETGGQQYSPAPPLAEALGQRLEQEADQPDGRADQSHGQPPGLLVRLALVGQVVPVGRVVRRQVLDRLERLERRELLPGELERRPDRQTARKGTALDWKTVEAQQEGSALQLT
eukprot:SAG22_NODE_2494_length_2512_cov_2.110651_3_plen_116_part_00